MFGEFRLVEIHMPLGFFEMRMVFKPTCPLDPGAEYPWIKEYTLSRIRDPSITWIYSSTTGYGGPWGC